MNRMRALAAAALLALAPMAAAQVQSRPDATAKTFDAWDADHNGVLSRPEFDNGWRAMVGRSVEARLRSQFEKLDRNDDGGLDGAEYASLALVLRAGNDAPALDAFDANGDKRLQFNEYIASVRALVAANRKPDKAQP
ncbi:MAG: EF-hand domain-containing protein [Pseudomonadota bacterium]|nr:EF-hand domain-containing protein [Pseudomonadota bacterium]